MLSWLKRLFGGQKQEVSKPPPDRTPPRPRARYDSAQDWESTKGLWAGTDCYSGRTANSLFVRRKLRDRSRYECANNGYAGGLVRGLADDVVGTGPRLQVLTGNQEWNAQVEREWKLWAEGEGVDPRKSVRLASKLRLMAKHRCREGEAFGVLTTNENLLSRVKLDMLVVETDQFSTPFTGEYHQVDGVELDAQGKPAYWHMLREHPGDFLYTTGKYDRIPASRVLQWFDPDRATDVRAVPEITASLPLFGKLRQWTSAILMAADTAARFAGILKPDKDSPGAEASKPGDPFTAIPIVEGAFNTLPPGADFEQMEAKHPTSTYSDFKHELLKEAGRPVRAPYSKSAGDSSPYNYSSAKMDEGDYRNSGEVVRGLGCEGQVLDPLFSAFLDEARLIPGVLPDGFPDVVPHVWHWPAARSIDPLKDAQADTERLSNGTTTLARIYAEQGLDWEEQLTQLAKEVKRCEELGITHPAAKQVVRQAPLPAEPDDGQADPENPDDAPPRGRGITWVEARRREFAKGNGHGRNGHP